MRDVLTVERQGDHLIVAYQQTDDQDEFPLLKPFVYDRTEESLHSELVRAGYLRTEPVRGDAIAGRWVRKVAA